MPKMRDKEAHTIEEIQIILQKWGLNNFRDFPWRHTKDPYRIMIAEFMLHRTKAEQVLPVYSSFIKKYPDVLSLSQADKNEIRKVTEHLGLHWRSEHFIESATYIVQRYNGIFPEKEAELQTIPGVGDYVAGAILTVCFKKPYPVVDSNIARFINRFYGLKLTGEIRRKKEIVNLSRELFALQNPDMLLFAILDFTAIICKPKKPQHAICPLKDHCKHYREEAQEETNMV